MADETRETELWQVLDWSLWGNGLADVLRFPMADVMVAALTEEQREQAEACIKAWHERRGPSMAVGVGTALERERNTLRAAYEYLAAAVREHGKYSVTNKLLIAEYAMNHGPQVIERVAAGKCPGCGICPPEDGYITCWDCVIRDREVSS